MPCWSRGIEWKYHRIYLYEIYIFCVSIYFFNLRYRSLKISKADILCCKVFIDIYGSKSIVYSTWNEKHPPPTQNKLRLG
jgi:hypothetical protein